MQQPTFWLVRGSDIKRGQNPEAEAKNSEKIPNTD